MGVINLGLLVDKIKRKLENSGFIKNTDYASASAAGVIKAGDGISVNATTGVATVPKATADSFGIVKPGSGISIADGVISAAAGVSMTKIGELDSPLSGAGTKSITLSSPVSAYNLLIVSVTNNDGQMCCTVLNAVEFAANTAYSLIMYSNSGNISNGFLKVDTTDATLKTLTLEAKAGTRFVTCKIYAL